MRITGLSTCQTAVARLLKLVTLLFFTYATAYSQTSPANAFASLAEKIYLQTDSKVFTTDKTIWFKAIVTQAIDHVPTALSAVLYVELIDPLEQVTEKKLVKIVDGIGSGYFELNESYKEGVYQLRAYTEWNKNFGSDFIFKEYLQVFKTTPSIKSRPIHDINVINEDNRQRLTAMIDALALDSLHTKDLDVFISINQHTDSIAIKRNNGGKYALNYTLPPDVEIVRLDITTKNGIHFNKNILLTRSYTDLQFFAESGNMVQGLTSRIGFKALDSLGKGKMVKGDIINRRGEVITRFSSNAMGMGTFVIPTADTTQHYIARLTTPSSASQKLFPLPTVTTKGTVLSVTGSPEKINLRVRSTDITTDSVLLRASCRGMAYFDIKGKLKNGAFDYSLPVRELPDGIIAFTVMNAALTPLAERIFFNDRHDARMKIQVHADRASYAPRDQTKLDIDLNSPEPDSGKASLSVLVINRSELGEVQSSRQNILSYLLLGSELRGAIENPGDYFKYDSTHLQDLDALLLTQGWRRYKFDNPIGKLTFPPEFSLGVSGHITGGLSGKKQMKGIGLTLMTFGPNTSIHTQETDSMGRFNFVLNDEYQQRMNILIQTNNKTGVKRDYNIYLDNKPSPPISFEHADSYETPDSIIQQYVKKNIERKKSEDVYKSNTGGIVLQEAIVKTYALTPERKKVIDQYGKPDLIIDGDDIRAKEAKWSYGLYSVLLFNFPDKVNVVRGPNGTLYAGLYNRESTLVVIDGIPVRSYDYPLIPSIPPSEVKSFEIIEYAKNFSSLYCEIFPQSCANAPMAGNVIAIYTYAKNGLFGATRTIGINKASIPVFAPTREFYAPKYDATATKESLRPDLRTVIHWEPNLRPDSLGHITTSFYNADITGTMEIIIEAIGANGEIGYRQGYYNVKK